MADSDQKAVTDDGVGMTLLLDDLSDGRLARRIADAARLAVAQHMLQTAQGTRSAVEADVASG